MCVCTEHLGLFVGYRSQAFGELPFFWHVVCSDTFFFFSGDELKSKDISFVFFGHE